MAVRESVELEDGVAVVRHRADAHDAERLRRTAERLQRAAHPGVVAVRRSGPSEAGWELVTDHGGHPVGPARLADPRRLAGVAADVAETLAALHERGIVHGRLEARHVLVGAGGRAVLCGFGTGDAEAAGPEDDVGRLGALVAELARGLAGTDRHDRACVEGLLAVAERAQVEPASRRPPARRLAGELRRFAAEAPPGRRRALRGSRRSAAVVAAGVAIVAIGVAAGLAALAPDGGGAPAAAGPVAGPTAGPTASSRSDRLPPAGGADPPCVAREGQPVTAAARCGQRAVVEGAVVVVDGQRSVVGRAGDEVVVADWACEGVLRPAVLRPSTGEVLVLSPPDAGGARVVDASVRVPGAAELVVRADEDGCPRLLVAAADGRPQPLPLPDDPSVAEGARTSSGPTS